MESLKIKHKLQVEAGSVKAAAEAIGEPLYAVSHTINYYRKNERIRQKLKDIFGVHFSVRNQARVNDLKRKAA